MTFGSAVLRVLRGIMIPPRESESMRCFIHGLAHLIDVFGDDEALLIAAWAVISLLEGRSGGPATPSAPNSVIQAAHHGYPGTVGPGCTRPSERNSSLDTPVRPIVGVPTEPWGGAASGSESGIE